MKRCRYRRQWDPVFTAMRLLVVSATCLALLACSKGAGPVDPPDDELPPVNEPLPGRTVFPADNAWNRDISAEPVDPRNSPNSRNPRLGLKHNTHIADDAKMADHANFLRVVGSYFGGGADRRLRPFCASAVDHMTTSVHGADCVFRPTRTRPQ